MINKQNKLMLHVRVRPKTNYEQALDNHYSKCLFLIASPILKCLNLGGFDISSDDQAFDLVVCFSLRVGEIPSLILGMPQLSSIFSLKRNLKVNFSEVFRLIIFYNSM